MRNYIEELYRGKDTMIGITLDSDTLNKIDDFVKKVIQKKYSEKHHLQDSSHEYKRFYTGMLGECAIEKFFNCNFIDWTIGNSSIYNVADLNKLGLDVGIKTVEFKKFPIIHKVAKRPELICIRKDLNHIIFCGLATVDVLNKYQDKDLILSPNLRKRGTKIGFYGFRHLIKINSLEDLKNIIEKKEKEKEINYEKFR